LPQSFPVTLAAQLLLFSVIATRGRDQPAAGVPALDRADPAAIRWAVELCLTGAAKALHLTQERCGIIILSLDYASVHSRENLEIPNQGLHRRDLHNDVVINDAEISRNTPA
jgi:hypothetical protein